MRARRLREGRGCGDARLFGFLAGDRQKVGLVGGWWLCGFERVPVDDGGGASKEEPPQPSSNSLQTSN